jgi:ADP-heptose:LPS heptosyltransferase
VRQIQTFPAAHDEVMTAGVLVDCRTSSEGSTWMLKKLELAWKAVWLAVFCAIARVLHRTAPVPDWRVDSCRVLFLRPDRIGDAIVSTGVFREIVARSPKLTLDVLASPRNRSILESVPSISAVRVFDRSRWADYPKLIGQLRSARYDAVIDCMVTAPSLTCLLLMLASGARHRIGIGGRGVDSALTVQVPVNRNRTHIVDLLAAFGPVFGADLDRTDWRPRLQVAEGERGRAMGIWEGADGVPTTHRVLVNVSAGRPARNWPERHFAAAIDHIRDRLGGAEFVVIGAPTERDRVERIASSAGARAIETPDIRDVVALVSTATFLLTPDTSVAHMASALGTPAVAMYLRGTAGTWGLYGSPGVSLEAETSSLATLPLATVLDAVDRVIDGATATV